ncbi:MAG: ABC transporter ATP-binding protein [Caulobacterales bacterium]|nr:ABC transporter ATP-binding protein [Caulobacterales bacterium]MCA0372830.1 ABC transporter ATP-binding protein/permease [Pseudomonadota bacterium]
MADAKQNKPLLRFWRNWLGKQKAILAFAAIMMIIVAFAVSAQSFMVGFVIDALANLGTNPDKIIKFGFTAKQIAFYGPIAVVIISLLRGIGWYTSNIATNIASMRATTDLQNDLFSKILTLDYARITREQSGAFSARFLNDINAIREAVLKVTNSLVKESFTLIFMVGMMLYMDWQLALVTLFILPLAYLPVDMIGRKIRKSASVAQEQASHLSGVIEESLGGIRLVKTYSLEKSEASRVENALLARMKLMLRMIEQRGRLLPILESMGGIAVAAVIAFAAYRISQGQSTVGNLMAFIASLLNASASLRSFGDMNNQLQEGISGLHRFYEILDEEPSIKDTPNPIHIERAKGDIKFENVDFAIGETKILNSISFNAEFGKTIAFVGASGAGKSSIINLIPRLFDVTGGTIYLDGIDIRQIELKNLRDQIALVSQDAILFETTIAQNVCFGAGQKTDEEIISALKQAACDFVFELPDGINSHVAPKGSNFSGGQRQRLALARAILRNAPILMLDEPTSALDSENEAKIQISLNEFCKNRTTLVVAHRLSTVANADKILVMANGEIVETGTHNELLAKGGIYSDLAKLQLR